MAAHPERRAGRLTAQNPVGSPKPKPLTPARAEKFLREGMSIRAIGRAHNVSYSRVRQLLSLRASTRTVRKYPELPKSSGLAVCVAMVGKQKVSLDGFPADVAEALRQAWSSDRDIQAFDLMHKGRRVTVTGVKTRALDRDCSEMRIPDLAKWKAEIARRSARLDTAQRFFEERELCNGFADLWDDEIVAMCLKGRMNDPAPLQALLKLGHQWLDTAGPHYAPRLPVPEDVGHSGTVLPQTKNSPTKFRNHRSVQAQFRRSSVGSKRRITRR